MNGEMILLYIDPPPFNAPLAAWKAFVKEMDGAAAQGDPNAKYWTDFGRRCMRDRTLVEVTKKRKRHAYAP